MKQLPSSVTDLEYYFLVVISSNQNGVPTSITLLSMKCMPIDRDKNNADIYQDRMDKMQLERGYH